MKNRTLHNAFPIVAAALGNRFGIKVGVGGDEAYTDGQSIQLPAYDGNDPDYQDYAWGLLAHEAAHIRYSDFTLAYGRSVLRRRLAGAIEDVRIEHELAKDFPGTRLTLRTVIDKMIAKGGFVASTASDHPANVLYGYVLKSLRARVLGQVALQPLVDQTETALKANFPNGAVVRLKGLLSEVPEALHSESDCLSLTDRILTMIEQEVEQQKQNPSSQSPALPSPPSPSPSPSPSSAADPETDEVDQVPSDQTVQASETTEGTDVTEIQDNAVGQNLTGEASTDKQGEDDPNALQANDETIDPTDYQPILDALLMVSENDIDQDLFAAIKSALTLAQNSVSQQVMPVGSEPPFDERAGAEVFNKVQSESVKIRAALQGLVQSQRLDRPRQSSRGRCIDGRRLPQLSLGDAKVFQRRAMKAAPNTAIHLLLDKSGSMNNAIDDKQGNALCARLPVALEASLTLALALEGLPGVNPGITAFPGRDDESVYRLLEHGQRVRSRAGAFALSASGGTPMTEAIWFGAASLLRCREPRKVLLVMTDGQPDDIRSTLDILQRCRDSGIETVGIGLGVDVSHLFPVALHINELHELRNQLFALSKSVLLAA